MRNRTRAQFLVAISAAVAEGELWEDFSADALADLDPKTAAATESFLHAQYTQALEAAVEFNVAETISTLLMECDKGFIQAMREEINENPSATLSSTSLYNLLDKWIGCRPSLTSVSTREAQRQQLSSLVTLENSEKLQRQLGSFVRQHFIAVATVYAPDKPEREMCNALSAWFRSGEMSREQRDIWKTLREETVPSKWRDVNWPQPHNGTAYAQFVSSLKKIKTPKFLRFDDIKSIFEIFLAAPDIQPVHRSSHKCLKVTGRIVFLSDVKEAIAEIIAQKDEPIREISIFAKNTLGIDIDLDNETWHGKNLCLVADVLVVCRATEIDVSGTRDWKPKERAASGENPGECGQNGEDGQAGESAGNVAILANRFVGLNLLHVKQNGSRGEDGQSGGDGIDGLEGKGVKEEDLIKASFQKKESDRSMFGTKWERFSNYNPDASIWTLQSERDSTEVKKKSYIYKEYKDPDRRRAIYSYATESGILWDTYDYYFVIFGADGNPGGRGGTNGLSGEAGLPGELIIRNMSTGHSEKLHFHESFNERAGKAGECGKSGMNGIAGNDMAIIDRNALASSFHILGKNGCQKLKISAKASGDKFSRLDGHRRYVLKESLWYTSFETVAISAGASVEAPKKRTTNERTSKSRAVCQATIVVDEVIEEFADLYAEDDALIQGACEVRFNEISKETHQQAIDEETVHEEQITIIRANISGSQIYRDKSPKAVADVSHYQLDPETVRGALLEFNSKTASAIQAFTILYQSFHVELVWDKLCKVAAGKVAQFLNSEIKRQLASSWDVQLPGISNVKVLKFCTTASERLAAKRIFFKIRKALPKKTVVEAASDANTIDFSQEELDDVTMTNESIFCEYQNPAIVKLHLRQFFSEHNNYITDRLLLLIQLSDVYKKLRKKHKNIFKPFENPLLNWANTLAVEKFFDQLERSDVPKTDDHLDEDEFGEGQEATEDMDLGSVPEATGRSLLGIAQSNYAHYKKAAVDRFNIGLEMVMKRPSSAVFNEVRSIIKSPKLQRLLVDLQKLLDQDDTEKLRFGNPRDFSEPRALVRLYFLSQRMLHSNAMVLRYFELFEAVTLTPATWHSSSPATDASSKKDKYFENFKATLIKRETFNINRNFTYFMETHGVKCAAVRQFLADELECSFRFYAPSGYGRFRCIESVDPLKISKDSKEEPIIYGVMDSEGNFKFIAPDMPLRLARSQFEQQRMPTSTFQLPAKVDLDTYFEPNEKQFVREWCDAFVCATGDVSCLHVLAAHFNAHSCHFRLAELHFILNTAIEAIVNLHLHPKSVAAMLMQPQRTLHEEALVLRLTFALRGGIGSDEMETIRRKLREVKDSRLLALFGSKLHERRLDVETILILLDMMKHASDRFSQLSQLALDEWVEIARHQRWTDLTVLLTKYGKLGYYIAYLESLNLQDEKKELEKLIDVLGEKDLLISEKLIARIAFLVASTEMKFSEAKHKEIVDLFESTNEWDNILKKCPDDDIVVTGPYRMIKNEDIQNRLIKQLSPECRQRVFPDDVRTMSTLVAMTRNPQDNEEIKSQRKEFLEQIAKAIGETEGVDDERIRQCAEHMIYIDKVLQEKIPKYSIKLRDAQKLAVVYAAAKNKHVLAQVNTGEGKSYIIAALTILKYLLGGDKEKETVDIITSSSVLAQRDAVNLKPIYEAFGITVAHNCDEDIEERMKAYKATVVYGDIARFQRDYLLQTYYKKNIRGGRRRQNVIVDEVDNMLLDNGNNILYLSHNVAGLEALESLFAYIYKQVCMPLGEESQKESEQEFRSETIKEAVLTDLFGRVSRADIDAIVPDKETQTKLWLEMIHQKVVDGHGYLRDAKPDNLKMLFEKLIKDFDRDVLERLLAAVLIAFNRQREIDVPEYLHSLVVRHLDEFIVSAKRAFFMPSKEDYVVDLDHTRAASDLCPQITIIDRNTGVDLATSQWSEGMQQFLQLKHGCRLTALSLKAVFISNVSYLKGYERISGFSGTLGSTEESKSLVDLYGADLIHIPTWKPKKFYEQVPLLEEDENEWLERLFEKVVEQATADRSVLMICRTIAEVEKIEQGLKGILATRQTQRTLEDRASSCIEQPLIYTREFDEVDFASTDGLPSCRLIISTNLAGRGTDIKLSRRLHVAGGLHVVVTFLPENTRIEEQAFGRAARDGEPGSGQIIALLDKSTNSESFGSRPNIFQMKQFRDNAEVHRLQSLKNFYKYNTEVEETCLQLFQKHTEKSKGGNVLASVYRSDTQADKNLPTAEQVVYFALLDKWAMWLDERSADIAHCAKVCNEHEKGEIIKLAGQFLAGLQLPEEEKKSADDEIVSQDDAYLSFVLSSQPTKANSLIFRNVNIERAIKWIQAPQPLLTLALIHLNDGNPMKADVLLDEILERFPKFDAEAHYYKGTIAQHKIREIRKIFIEIDEKAPPGRLRRWLIKAENIALRASTATTGAVLGYDYMPDMAVTCIREQQNATIRHLLHARGQFAARLNRRQQWVDAMERLAQEVGQHEIRSNGLMEQHCQIAAVIEVFIGNIDDIIGHPVSPFHFPRHPDEIQFTDVLNFESYVERGAMSNTTLTTMISPIQCAFIESRHGLSNLQQALALQRLREGKDFATCEFKPIVTKEVLKKVFALPSATDFWSQLEACGCFEEQWAIVAVNPKNASKLDEILTELRKFGLPDDPNIIQMLDLSLAGLNLYQITDCEDTNVALGKNLRAAKEAKLLVYEKFGRISRNVLEKLEFMPKFDVLLEESLAEELYIKADAAKWILDLLVDAKILEQKTAFVELLSSTENMPELGLNQERTVFRLKKGASIDCSALPSFMRDSVERLLYKHFAYGHALAALKASLDDTEAESRHRILLPANPYVDLFNDMVECGMVEVPRVAVDFDEIFEKKSLAKGVYDVLKEKRGTLSLARAEMHSTEEYLVSKGVKADAETRKAMQNGMRQLAVIEEKKYWKWFLGAFIVIAAIALVVVTLGLLTPVTAIICALVITAIVGTTIYFLQMRRAGKAIAKRQGLQVHDEIQVLRQFHRQAVEEHETAQEETKTKFAFF